MWPLLQALHFHCGHRCHSTCSLSDSMIQAAWYSDVPLGTRLATGCSFLAAAREIAPLNPSYLLSICSLSPPPPPLPLTFSLPQLLFGGPGLFPCHGVKGHLTLQAHLGTINNSDIANYHTTSHKVNLLTTGSKPSLPSPLASSLPSPLPY